MRVVREAHPSARIIVDANQGWTRTLLERLLPQLHELGVELVEGRGTMTASRELMGR